MDWETVIHECATIEEGFGFLSAVVLVVSVVLLIVGYA